MNNDTIICGFTENLNVYIQEVQVASKVMTCLTNNPHSYLEKLYNIAMFYYGCDNCVYVITTGKAWNLFQNCRDPEFPQSFADRLLTLKGPKDRNIKLLFSDISKKYERRKDGYKSSKYTFGDVHIGLSYTALLRDDASIYKLKCFPKKQQKQKKNPPKNVTVNYGSVRFKSPIIINSLPRMIAHLHKIYNRKATSTTKDEDEIDSEVYKQYLREPDTGTKRDLDSLLMESLKKSIKDVDDDAMENFELMYTKMDDILDATEFKLIIKKTKQTITVREVPTLKLVIQELRGKILEGNIGTVIQIEIGEIKDILWNFIEGMIVHNHLYYFRIFRKWYYISKDFYKQVQDEFVSCLQSLLAEKSNAQLKLPWAKGVDEGAYNDKYVNETNFLVGDRILTDDTKIEIFDLLFYDETARTTYLYHVKDGFGQSTRIVGDQICTAALIIHNHFCNIDTHILKEFHKNIVNGYEVKGWDLPQIFAEFNDFESLFKFPERLVFVCALRLKSDDISETNKNKSNLLLAEKKFKNKISVDEIKESVGKVKAASKRKIAQALNLETAESENTTALSKAIFNGLFNMEYIKKRNDSIADVNSTLLLTRKKYFQISEDASYAVNEIIHDEILRPYRTFFKSLTAKLNVIKMENQIGKLRYKFKICEIKSERSTKPTRKRNKNSNEAPHGNRMRKPNEPSTPSTSQK